MRETFIGERSVMEIINFSPGEERNNTEWIFYRNDLNIVETGYPVSSYLVYPRGGGGAKVGDVGQKCTQRVR